MGNIRPALGLAALLAVATAAVAQSDFYPFAIDQDRLSGAPDFSFLNHPITPADRLFIRDSHFFRLGPDLTPNTGDDERVHLFGVNLAFGANFPAEQDAARIAARLSRLGVNLVRLHHMDSSPDAKPANAGSLLTTGPYPTLNAVAVTRLRRFIDALKAEGIYIDLNLHVGYQFRPAIDDVPAHETFPRQSKPLHVFWPRMIELQADFTRQVIEALELNDDPALGVVEINNESSLIDTWQRQSLDTIVTGDYRSELTRQWNTHLAAAYPNTEALREAWGASEADGPDLLGERWVIENHTRFPARLEPAAEREESPVVRVETTGGGAPIIVKQTGFSVAAGRAYTAEVELRAGLAPGAGRGIYWDVKQDANPWRTVAGRTVTVTAAWQKFRMSVQPSFSIENGGRFGLSIENVGAPVYIRNWKLYAAGRRGLGEDESLEAKSVPLVAQAELATGPRLNDYLLFLIGCDRAYLDGILAVVREATGPLVPVAGTQLSFGGLANLDSHESLDYQDHHFYIDHYNFPNRAWDGRDWRMRDTSAVGTGLQSLLNMAAGHQAGRPYTVSEYNQPWPNTHAAETDPVIAVFGRFQDWDSVMHFAYSHGRGWDDGVPNGFNINGDWTKFPNFGQSAWLFRSGAIQVGREPVEIPMPLEQRLRATRERRNGSIASFLNASLGYDPALALRHPVRLVKDSDAALPQAAREKL
ncbi:MAG: hypothetical protein HYS04_23085, partial [Acidobacteria bacterium]|nr:hypothetical protein [Acidobacteriota bacterium]